MQSYYPRVAFHGHVNQTRPVEHLRSFPAASSGHVKQICQVHSQKLYTDHLASSLSMERVPAFS